MIGVPTKANNPDGFHQRYIVTKADGEPVDPNAIYVVLRIDRHGRDPEWTDCCRRVVWRLVNLMPNRMSRMAYNLRALLQEIEETQ